MENYDNKAGRCECPECLKKRKIKRRSNRIHGLVLFPVLCHRKVEPFPPKGVPSWWIEQFKDRIERNHSQMIGRLAQRGGLDAKEIWCAAHDKRWIEGKNISEEAAILWLTDCMSSLEENVRNVPEERS